MTNAETPQREIERVWRRSTCAGTAGRPHHVCGRVKNRPVSNKSPACSRRLAASSASTGIGEHRRGPAVGRRARLSGTAGVGLNEMAALVFDLWRWTSDACRPPRSPVFFSTPAALIAPGTVAAATVPMKAVAGRLALVQPVGRPGKLAVTDTDAAARREARRENPRIFVGSGSSSPCLPCGDLGTHYAGARLPYSVLSLNSVLSLRCHRGRAARCPEPVVTSDPDQGRKEGCQRVPTQGHLCLAPE